MGKEIALRASARNGTGRRSGKVSRHPTKKRHREHGQGASGAIRDIPRLALRLAGLPNCSPGKRSATGDACDIEALQRFQHPYFAVHVAGAAQRPVNVLEAEMFI
ncbi:hypothetical protein NUBL12144_23680 [Klebsiella pneumoniae]|nr:hypothetical protein NUBL12144_23680 [Klebsiella pneumoniae]